MFLADPTVIARLLCALCTLCTLCVPSVMNERRSLFRFSFPPPSRLTHTLTTHTVTPHTCNSPSRPLQESSASDTRLWDRYQCPHHYYPPQTSLLLSPHFPAGTLSFWHSDGAWVVAPPLTLRV